MFSSKFVVFFLLCMVTLVAGDCPQTNGNRKLNLNEKPFGVAHLANKTSPFTPKLTDPFEGTKVYEFNMSGGFPWCSNCGAGGDYQCTSAIGSGNLTLSYDFEDQVPSGSTPLGIRVELVGCFGESSEFGSFRTDFFLNQKSALLPGTWLGAVISSENSEHCECGQCDGRIYETLQWVKDGGVPHYKRNGNNTITFESKQGICVHSLRVTVAYGQVPQVGLLSEPSNTGPGVWRLSLEPSAIQSLDDRGCGDGRLISYDFTNPLPAGKVLVGAVVRYLFAGICADDGVGIFAQLQGHSVVGDEAEPMSSWVTTGEELASNSGFRVGDFGSDARCGTFSKPSASRFSLDPSPLFQTGWPDYKYGAKDTNEFSIQLMPDEFSFTSLIVADNIVVDLLFG